MPTLLQIKNAFSNFGFGVPLALLLIMAMMILPIPPVLLDLLFTFSITLSMLVLLTGIYVMRPLEFASFPTVLLLATLTRLALNIASTRVVLLHGHQGTDAAGKVIEAFGNTVIGGNYAVGVVVFCILVIINFVVVTKGGGRISEVSARFTLDSLPGKQMAIDADLNSGLIDQEEAMHRREDLSQEADFYGSMDGASKFVRGDAIAGILILVINLLGGMFIGMFQHDLSLSAAAQIYALLTIGDGLVAQIPALILSTAAAIMVTRVSKSEDMSNQVYLQLFSEKPLLVAGFIMMGLGLIPGMPHKAFIIIGFLSSISSLYLFNAPVRDYINNNLGVKLVLDSFKEISGTLPTQVNAEPIEEPKEKTKDTEITWDDVPKIDTIGMEIGYRLIPMVDQEQSGELMNRIKGVRKKISQELGFLVPAIHIKDNLDLVANSYRISILGVVVGEDKIQIEQDMAINPGQNLGKLNGIAAKEPAFGLDAYWIDKKERQNAQTLGYTVVDSSTVIATHISQIIRDHAQQLIGHQEVQKMLDLLAQDNPQLVANLVPDTLSLGIVVKTLQNLLVEHIPLRDMRTIVEVLSEYGDKIKDPSHLTELVRNSMGPMIVQQIFGISKEISVATLSQALEQLLHKSLQSTDAGQFSIEPGLAEQIQVGVNNIISKFNMLGLPNVLVVSSTIRPMMAKLCRGWSSGLNVISYQEIPDDKKINVVATIGN